jgi:glycosyltransferase involved in cell wall biosynthesis
LTLALVHDYLNQRGGAERVFEHFARAWPQAPVYTALHDPRVGNEIDAERLRLSYLAKVPGANRAFRFLAPFYPRAFESFDFTGFDTIVSSTSAWAKGVLVPPGAVHVCFIHTVSRFAFNYDEYVGGFGVRALARPMVKKLVEWDARAAQRPTRYVANSHNVARRVKEYYGRDADVLHSPIDVDRFSVGAGRGDYVLIASRLLPYKRIELAIRAAARAGITLVVAGTGPAEAALRRAARGTNARMLGYVDDATLNGLMGDARAVILPGEEDLGLVPLEAAACGRPTIAYRGGGALETVIEGETGAFFDAPEPESLAAVLRGFDAGRYDAARLRAHAERFSPQMFVEKLKAIVSETRGTAG